MVINSNLMSLNTQRQLQMSRSDLDTTMQRLASGKRINSAADDAAGLAITSKLTSQVRGLSQAIRNANDGISMLQTAEGAMDESTNILQRMRELSIQAANGIYNDSNRASLNAEYAQLMSELDRIAETTAFNGLKILNGSVQDLSLQVGASASETIGLNFSGITTADLGLFSASSQLISSGVNIDSTTGLLANDFDRTISFDTVFTNDGEINLINDVFRGDTLATLIAKINSDIEGVEASTLIELDASMRGNGDLTNSDTLTIKTFDLNGNARDFVIGDTTTVAEIANKINRETEGYLTASVGEAGGLKITSTEAATLLIKDSTGGLATGIVDNSIVDPDAAKIIEAIKNYWVAEAEDLIFAEYGLRGVGESLQINLFEDSSSSALAYVSYGFDSQGEAINFSLNVNLSYYQDIVLPDGDNGETTLLDRVIAHEMTHAVFGTNFDYTNALAPSWFTEGFPELVQGADERILNDFGTGKSVPDEATFQTLWGTVSGSNTGSPTTSAGYSAAYLAAKILTDGILAAGNSLSDFFQDIKTESEKGTLAGFQGAISTAITANTGWADLAAFEAAVFSEGWEYFQQGLNDDATPLSVGAVSLTPRANFQALTTDPDVGSIAGADYGKAILASASVLPNNPTAGEANFYQHVYTDEYRGDYRTVDAALVLRSETGDDFKILASYLGTDADLANLGFTAATGVYTNNGSTPEFISTISLAQSSITQIDRALDTLAQRRGDIGAAMNRLDFSVNNLSNIVENASATRSRIEDADYAAESAALWRSNVLQSAGIAMLSQANAQPQQILSLLRA